MEPAAGPVGGLWIGTASGVSRYDGNTFSNFKIPEANITGHVVRLMRSMAEDREGNKWFGSNGRGVIRYDGTDMARFSRQDGLGSDIVQTIMQDRAGALWFGTRDGGLSRYDGIAFAPSPMKADADGGYAWTMLGDRAGSLWVGTSGGVYRFNGKTFSNFTREDAERKP